MLRNVTFALTTAVALSAAALVTTSAFAHGFGPGGHFVGAPHVGPGFGPHHWGHRWGWGVGIGAGLLGGAIVADTCIRREVFYIPRMVRAIAG